MLCTSRRAPQDALRLRLRGLAGVRISYGYRRPHVLLRLEGGPVNAKRVYRLYVEEGLGLANSSRDTGSPRRGVQRHGQA